MEEQIISLKLAGEPLRLRLRHGMPPKFFEGFLDPSVPADTPAVEVPPERIEAVRALYPGDFSEALLECNELPAFVSDQLLPVGCCVFHGAAFAWRGKVYIFTAPSGTGKSTQYVLWKELLGDALQIINGDKPVLRLGADGTVSVHPSPWRGKERMGSLRSGPLGGIILLEQGSVNTVKSLTPAESAAALFTQFVFTAGTAASVHQVCRLESCMLSTVPVWRLTNRGDTDSARLCMETIVRYEEERK